LFVEVALHTAAEGLGIIRHLSVFGTKKGRHHRVSTPPGAPTIAEVRTILDSMGIGISISALAPRQSIELSK